MTRPRILMRLAFAALAFTLAFAGDGRPASRGMVAAVAAETRAVGITPLDARLRADGTLRGVVCSPDQVMKLQPGEVAVPILLYHFVGRSSLEVDGRSTSRYNMTAANFELQLALLQRLGYHTVLVSEIIAAISGEGELPEHPIAITVDDGWIEQYNNLFPLLQKYGMVATFYVPSSYPVGGRLVTWEQLKTMIDAGMEVGAHTRKHVDLVGLDQATVWQELTYSKQVIEEKLGITVTSMSYPFGLYTTAIMSLAQEAGYQAALALSPSIRQYSGKAFALSRIEISGTRPLSDFMDRLPWRGLESSLCEPIPSRLVARSQ